ncbi:MAG: hypothetical protein K8S99_00525 [Planctomycetes bacterium]|nr:hypothetical protein [Planctomycetota bacterium]
MPGRWRITHSGLLRVVMTAALLLLATPGALRAAVIGFDGIDATGGPVVITDLYRPQGAVFDYLAVQNIAAQTFYTTSPRIGLASQPNVAVLNDEAPLHLITTLTFVLPNTAIDGVVHGAVGAYLFDGNVGTLLVRMTAYNLYGQQLDLQEVQTPAAGFAYVQVTGHAIHTVTLEADTDGSTFDQLTFGQVIPEPTSAATLLLCGPLLLRRQLRRRRS